MKRITLFLLSAIFTTAAFSQNVNCYRIYLHDKEGTPYSIDQPEEFLSQRCLDKRARYDVPVTEQDLPLSPTYISAIEGVSAQLRVLSKSKWTNTLTVWCPDTARMADVRALAFVDSVKPVGFYESMDNRLFDDLPVYDQTVNPSDSTTYGKGAAQLALHNGQLLHAQGYRGEGMLIAMLDAGWLAFERTPWFANLYENGQIWGTRNFVPGMENVYLGHSHGTSCASTIVSNVFANDPLVGVAPNANIFFIRTEDPEFEMLIEEDFFAAGLEVADSIGADIVTASLGYTRFDDSSFVFDYSSCDGHTSICSQAATIAAHKAMVVCSAAGNDGANEWHKLSRPSDAEDILCVGAVNVDSVYAPFSSCGPSYDGRVKPDVVSCGYDTYVVAPGTYDGENPFHYMVIYAGNGTSFATPIMAGMATCLWQALPQLNSLEIMQIIRESGHQYNAPDTLLGYGIPNIYQAWLDHRTDGIAAPLLPTVTFTAFPNPCSSQLTIRNPGHESVNICAFDLRGRVVFADNNFNDNNLQSINTTSWPAGTYLVRVQRQWGRAEIIKVVKE